MWVASWDDAAAGLWGAEELKKYTKKPW
jgi:hypothetical protein